MKLPRKYFILLTVLAFFSVASCNFFKPGAWAPLPTKHAAAKQEMKKNKHK